jgi:hypothetical protein
MHTLFYYLLFIIIIIIIYYFQVCVCLRIKKNEFLVRLCFFFCGIRFYLCATGSSIVRPNDDRMKSLKSLLLQREFYAAPSVVIYVSYKALTGEIAKFLLQERDAKLNSAAAYHSGN